MMRRRTALALLTLALGAAQGCGDESGAAGSAAGGNAGAAGADGSASDVLVEDVTLVNSTLWNMRLWGCDGVVIRGVTIESDLELDLLTAEEKVRRNDVGIDEGLDDPVVDRPRRRPANLPRRTSSKP